MIYVGRYDEPPGCPCENGRVDCGTGTGARTLSQSDRAETDETASPARRPEEIFGHEMGAPRRLVRWPALLDYFQEVASRSDRVLIDVLGDDSGGQPLVSLTISSPGNLAQLDDWKAIQARLADQRGLSTGERERLIATGKAIVLITCSIHGTEVGGTQMTPELVYRLATSDDPEVVRILDEVILLLVPSLNPSGLEMVADWYERTLDTPFEGSNPPGLYHRFAGHDNNRDWFMQVLTENRLVIQKLHNPWRPHIVYDLHQMQSNGPRYVVPPFIDPYDQNIDPILQAAVNDLGSSMALDLTADGRTGVATGIIFDAFSPSRAYQFYHGGVRILSEAASAKIATSVDVPIARLVDAHGFDPKVPLQNHPAPWGGGEWSLRTIVEYNLVSAWAVLNHAARFRDRWVRNFAAVQQRSLQRSQPFAYLIPSPDHQRDPGAVEDLIETLRLGDIEVNSTIGTVVADGVDYPAGTLVVELAQPFGGYARTLLEVQRYPDLRLYPGGPPRPPYDNTAHTLPLQLGVQAIEVHEPFEVTTRPVAAHRSAGGIRTNGPVTNGYLVSPRTNASVRFINAALARGATVGRLTDSNGTGPEPGTYLVDGLSAARIDEISTAQGVPVDVAPVDAGHQIRPVVAPRVGLYRSWRGQAVDSGWTELILDEYGFEPRLIRNRDIRQGGLRDRFDVIVLPQESARAIADGNDATQYPREFAGGLGDLGAYHLRRFVEEGGTLVALDSASGYAISALYLPVRNVLENVTQRDFYSPGSLVRLLLDTSHPVAWGLERETAAMFVSSPVFNTHRSSGARTSIVAQHAESNQLLSGWMHGADRIAGRAALVDVTVGKGRVILFGFRPQYRAQARGTYRLLFNSLYLRAMSQ